MSALSTTLPTQEQALCLHERLVEQDSAAPYDIFTAYLDPLTAWLDGRHADASPDFRAEAAHLALISYVCDPATYKPNRGTLAVYLRVAAQGDLRNLLRREARHHEGRKSWEDVEHSPGGGKYLGRDDDPSLRLRIAEETRTARDPAVADVLGGCSAAERRVLELMLGGERRTAVFAEVLGLLARSKAEQRREVKRTKDCLKQRMKRAREYHEQIP